MTTNTLPAVGSIVRAESGPHRGRTARVDAVNGDRITFTSTDGLGTLSFYTWDLPSYVVVTPAPSAVPAAEAEPVVRRTPVVGERVRVTSGAYRGYEVTVEGVNALSVTVRTTSGLTRTVPLTDLPEYEVVSAAPTATPEPPPAPEPLYTPEDLVVGALVEATDGLYAGRRGRVTYRSQDFVTIREEGGYNASRTFYPNNLPAYRIVAEEPQAQAAPAPEPAENTLFDSLKVGDRVRSLAGAYAGQEGTVTWIGGNLVTVRDDHGRTATFGRRYAPQFVVVAPTTAQVPEFEPDSETVSDPVDDAWNDGFSAGFEEGLYTTRTSLWFGRQVDRIKSWFRR